MQRRYQECQRGLILRVLWLCVIFALGSRASAQLRIVSYNTATGESNGDSHLKSILVHHQVVVPITKGKLDLGPWQQVFYGEFDGQRSKRLVIKAMGD